MIYLSFQRLYHNLPALRHLPKSQFAVTVMKRKVTNIRYLRSALAVGIYYFFSLSKFG